MSEPELVKCKMLETITRLNGGGFPVGAEAALDRAEACYWLLMNWITPIGWTPSKAELEKAAPEAWARIEAIRRGRGIQTEQAAQGVPFLARVYQNIANAVGAK